MQVNSTNVSVGDVNQILLSLGGVIQKPGTDFTVSGSTLTFTTAPAANTSFFAILLGSDNGGTVTPTDGSVTTAKIVDDAVSAAKIDINGAELFLDADDDTSITADTDDQIDFKVGGNDTHVFDANGHITLKQFLDATTAGGRITGASNRGSTARVNLYQTAGSSDGGEIRLETANTSNSMTEAVRIHNNQVMSASAGIALGVGTANTSSNVLNDYEEGEWTIGFEDASGNAMTLNSTYRKGFYTKIGHRVIIQGYGDISSAGSASGNMRMTGLPFSVINNVAGYSALTAYPENMSLGTAGYSVVGYTNVNASRITLGLTDTANGQTHLQASEMGTGNLIFSAVYVTNE
jgi:hypothetical protein